MRRQLFTVAAALVVGAAAVAAQRPQVPAFRSGITLVPIDVRVLDRSGRPITDLTEDDFAIFEDDEPQLVAHFSKQALTPVTPEPGARPALRRTSGLELDPPNQRVFLIVLGRGRLQAAARGFDGLVELVRERLLPQDPVAVVAYNRVTDLTTDHARIARLLERLRRANDAIEAKLNHHYASLQVVYGSLEIPDRIQTMIDDAFAEPGVLLARELPPAGIPDGAQLDADTARILDALDLSDPDATDNLAERQRSVDDLRNLYMGVEYLRYLEGEKHLIFVTEFGFVGLERAEHAKSLAAVAADARVAISPVQTGGLPTAWAGPIFMGRPWKHTTAYFDGRTVAELTGGLASFYRYASTAVRRLDEATRFHYSLGYYPSNNLWDGAYRRIRVEVKRPGATAHFRHGYFARHDLVPYERRRFLTYSRVLSAGAWALPIRDIPVSVSPRVDGPAPDTGAFDVEVDVTIEPTAVLFREELGRHVASLDVAVFVADAHETLAGEAWETINLKLGEQSYARLAREPLVYTARMRTAVPPRHVKAVVYDYAADRLGTGTARIR